MSSVTGINFVFVSVTEIPQRERERERESYVPISDVPPAILRTREAGLGCSCSKCDQSPISLA